MSDGATTLPPANTALGVGAGDRAAAAGTARCPHCGHENPRDPVPGAIVDCAHCDRSFAQPRPATGAAGGGGRDRILARSPTDVGLRATGALALALSVLFYGVVVRPLSDSYFGDLFGDRGWVPYVITWLSLWAFVLLGVKARLLAAQRRTLSLDLLPEALHPRITPENAAAFQQHLHEVAGREPPPSGVVAWLSAPRSFLVERVDRALDRFRMRGSSEDVVDQLLTQSQLDANSVESSYTMIRVFIWAIPLLGFIGTVVGISAAVAGFSDSVAQAVDLEVMKQSIGTVTVGLGVAFDTTLLALVMSILIMFPTSSLQKAEEDFLARVDAWCDERLGRRLQAERTDVPDPGHAQALEQQIARLARSIEALGARLGSGR